MSVQITNKIEAVACRGCLSTYGNLYNIVSAQLLEPYEDLIGYPIGSSDVYPKYLCMYCRTQLLNFQSFREKCRNVLEILKDAQNAGYTLSTGYIRSIDRQYYNLNTNYAQTKTNIIECGRDKINIDPSPYVNNRQHLARKTAKSKKYKENEIGIKEIEDFNETTDTITRASRDKNNTDALPFKNSRRHLARKAAKSKNYNENDIGIEEIEDFNETADTINHLDDKNTADFVINDKILPDETESFVDDNQDEWGLNDWRDEYLDINSDSHAEGNDSSIGKNVIGDKNDSLNTENDSKLDEKKQIIDSNHMMSNIVPVISKIDDEDKKSNSLIDNIISSTNKHKFVDVKVFDSDDMNDSDPEIDDLIKLFLCSPKNYTKIVTKMNDNPKRKATIAKNKKRSKRKANNSKTKGEDEEINDKSHKKAKTVKTDDETPEEEPNDDFYVPLNDKIKARAEALHFNVEFYTREEQFEEVRNQREAIIKPPYTTKCEICGEHFVTVATKMTHYDSFHNPNSKHTCPVCYYRFKDKLSLAKHSREHKYLFSCKHCEFVTRKRDQLEKHFKDLHKEDDNVDHICPYCGKAYMKGPLHYHIKTEHPNELLPCDLCSTTVLNNKDLKRHHNTAHKDVKIIECHCSSTFFNENALVKHQDSNRCDLNACKHCGVNLTTEQQLKDHLYKHRMQYDMVEDYYHECDCCKVLFQSTEALETHLEVCTEGGFPCIHCGESLGSRDLLEEHLGDKHASEEDGFNLNMATAPNVCDVCGKCFKTSQYLRQHKAVHTDGPSIKPKLPLRPNYCQICDKSFPNKSRLEIHMSAHSVERPYSCKYCMKTFKFKTGLYQHKMFHHTENKHVCPICGKSFNIRSEREDHIQEVHMNNQIRADGEEMDLKDISVKYDTIENHEGSEYLVLADDSSEETEV